MQLIYKDTRYVFVGTYADKDIPKKAGFRWDPQVRCWWTQYPETAAKLAQIADESCREQLAKTAQAHQQALAQSRAVDADIKIPAPEGLTYLPFQRAGVAYVVAHPNCIVGDEMGLGKTIQAIGRINADDSIRRVLVVCPASLRLNWMRELQKWCVRSLSVGIANEELPKTDVVILGYEGLSKFKTELRTAPYDLLIADESHYLKNPEAQRTIYALGGKESKAMASARFEQAMGRKPEKDEVVERIEIAPIQARYRLFLSGTPILNRPIELWPILRSLGVFKSWRQYVTRYCSGHQGRFGWDVSGASNLDELQDILRSKCMIRRLKSQVLTELPAKRRAVIELPVNGAAETVAKENAAYEASEAALADLRAAVEMAKASDNPNDYSEAVKRLADAAQVSFTEMARVRHETSLAKVPAAVAFAVDVLEGGTQKLVVFAHHHDVIDGIMAGLKDYNPVCLTGEMAPEDRQESVDRFQNDPTVRVFVGSIRAAGVGLTLTASSHVLFCELDWTPGNITQAEDRCHRIGQHNSVLIQHLVLEGSLDAKMAKALVEKTAVIDQALDVEQPIEALPLSSESEAATRQTPRNQLADEASKMSPEQVADIHSKLRYLAAMDADRALWVNGVGFNRIDNRLGHSLAEAKQLTPKQAALGARILRKYHQQLGAER